MIVETLKCKRCHKTMNIERFNKSGYNCDDCYKAIKSSEREIKIIEQDNRKKRDSVKDLIEYKKHIVAMCDGLGGVTTRRISEELIEVMSYEDLQKVIEAYLFETKLKKFWLNQSRGEILPLEYMTDYIKRRYNDETDRAIFYLKEWGVVC